MHLLTSTRFGLALSLCFIAVACASPSIPDDGNLADDGAGAATATKKPSTSSKKPTTNDNSNAPAADNSNTSASTPAQTPAPAPATPAGPIGTNCAGQSPDACFDCCNQASGGALAPADNVFGQCACGAGGQCDAVCDANLCSGLTESSACASCLQATCVPAEAAACTSAACKAGLQCAQQCN